MVQATVDTVLYLQDRATVAQSLPFKLSSMPGAIEIDDDPNACQHSLVD